ncbi:carbohydrate-binding module family 52 protein, partial [Mycena pura]
YTCYDGFLCPVIQNERTLKCNNDCYLPGQYSCTTGNGQLQPRAAQTGPFQVTVVSSPPISLIGQDVNACNGHFFLGTTAGSCTGGLGPDCPFGGCATYTNTTVFLPGNSMDTMVPGGQQYFVGPDGALGYTAPHSAAIPPGSSFDIEAFQGGLFVPPDSNGWLACPVTGSSQLQIFANLNGVVFPANCVSASLGVNAVPSGTVGAYEY